VNRFESEDPDFQWETFRGIIAWPVARFSGAGSINPEIRQALAFGFGAVAFWEF
jgi:hypothetical protein